MASVYKSLVSKTKEGSEETTAAGGGVGGVKKQNKQRVLILTSRGVTYRHRHLLKDLISLLPHSRKDAKLDTKSRLFYLNELAELYNCNNVLFFEARKRQDLYVWISKAPNGPCVKFHVQNLHTMEELNFTGNALKGSRPLLSFDKGFDETPALKLVKEMLVHTFGVPKGARKSKPFVDHVLAFTVADGKVWFRNYQISESVPSKKDEEAPTITTTQHKGDPATTLSLIEIGPRFVLTPIVILEGSFGGPKIYENKEFVSPNAVRSELRNRRAMKYNKRAEEGAKRVVKRKELGIEEGRGAGEMEDAVLFA